MISLCDQCANRGVETERMLREVYEMSGLGRPKSIWCLHRDRPEDERWQRCRNFKPYGQVEYEKCEDCEE